MRSVGSDWTGRIACVLNLVSEVEIYGGRERRLQTGLTGNVVLAPWRRMGEGTEEMGEARE
jgi:hypothetical protein